MAERDEAEEPFIAQLVAQGWVHLSGTALSPEDRTPGSPLLTGRLAAALRRINVLPGAASTWLGEDDIRDITDGLTRLTSRATPAGTGGESLHDVNREATDLLLSGTDRRAPHGRDERVRLIDWRDWSRNEFLVVSQYRVTTPGGRPAVLDLALLVNGIPLAVVECKSPDNADGLGLAIQDLRAYAGHYDEDDERPEGERPFAVPALFATAQLLIAATGDAAVVGTVDSRAKHYARWRSTAPEHGDEKALHRWLREHRLVDPEAPVTTQHMLIAVALKPESLLNVVRHYIIELPVHDEEGNAVGLANAVCRHQQYRTVEKILARLRDGRSRLDPAVTEDGRGGVVWHTQGSGKSLTMAFLARRLHMHPDPELNRFTLLVVTDRKQLEEQLSRTLQHSKSTVRTAGSRTETESMLRFAGQDGGRAVVFTTVQKYLGRMVAGPGADQESREDRDPRRELEERQRRLASGEAPVEQTEQRGLAGEQTDEQSTEEAVRREFAECSTSDRVLVLIDEAHRSHASVLHACLRQAVPNAARIGFTGTPILKSGRAQTRRIFGPYIDTYLLDEAERDGVVVRVEYEGRTGAARVDRPGHLDAAFEDLITPLSDAQREAMRRRYGEATARDVAESAAMIDAKAKDMLRHFILGPLTSGFKAQVAATSRRAAVMYREALRNARDELLERLRTFDPDRLRGVDPAAFVREEGRDDLLMLRVWHYQEILRRIDFVPVISEGTERKTGRWREWTDPKRQEDHIARFLKPFPHLPPDSPWATAHPVPPVALPMGRVGEHPGLNPWSRTAPHAAHRAARVPEDQPIVAFLIVKSMLLTGFDAPIEQVLYLDRPIQDAELLQAVARVNRPARRKEYGTVVDYYGVLANLTVTLAAYREDDGALPTPDGTPAMTDELPTLDAAATSLREFLARLGVTGDLGRADVRRRAVLALRDEELRAEFDALLDEASRALDRVLPHEKALPYVTDVRGWAQVRQQVRRLVRETPGGHFSLRSYGRKVRALIADHLKLAEIRQEIAPVSITDPHFDRAVERIARSDVEMAAAEQEHALRYHLEQRVRTERPAEYKRLSEALEEVLREAEGRWEEITERLAPLIAEARRQQETDPGVAGLRPTERLLHSELDARLNAEGCPFAPVEPELLRNLAVDLHGTIFAEVSLASFGNREEDLQRLQGSIRLKLRRRLREAGKGRDQAYAESIARHLAGHVQEHLARYRQSP